MHMHIVHFEFNNELKERCTVMLDVALAFTMTMFATFTQMTLMWSSTLLGAVRLFHVHSVPPLETIRHSLYIRLVQLGFAELFTRLAALMVYSCIVLLSRIQADRNGNQLARPATCGTGSIMTAKPPHDVRVVIFLAVAIVFLVEGEVEIVFFEQVRYCIVV